MVDGSVVVVVVVVVVIVFDDIILLLDHTINRSNNLVSLAVML